ncbi:hypothetical protein VNO78_05339 [Psophocarpus tetragonolobus]|uniref:Uncharacterized protein n=1 Tax=Psophocarpus tetragonolobus TaxID=3891 RepID=A0AAN9XQP0_PSOTE
MACKYVPHYLSILFVCLWTHSRNVEHVCIHLKIPAKPTYGLLYQPYEEKSSCLSPSEDGYPPAHFDVSAHYQQLF